jgi:RNA polymerase sigma factor (sigma-70 family)
MPRTRPAAVVRRLASAAADPPGDRQLLRAFVASRSEPAFAEIVRRHGPTVLGVCRRVLGCAHDAEDAFQATFLVLARKAGSVRGGNLAGWLYGVAVRTARGVRLMRDRRRKRLLRSQRSEDRGQNTDNGAVDLLTPDLCLLTSELAAIIDEELARLPECYRAAVVLCELQGRPRKDAAAELGIPEGTLSSRLAAARRKLADQLARRGITAPAAALSAALAPTASAQLPDGLARVAVTGGASAAAVRAADVVVKAMFAAQLKGLVLAAGLVAALVGGGFAMSGGPGGSAAAGEPPAAPAPRESVDAHAIVKQLGSADFATREAAEKKLRALGAAARPALLAGTRDADPEVSRRSRSVLESVRKDAREDLAKRFDAAGSADYDHPVWQRFKKLAGSDAPARKLFAAIIADPRRLQLLDAAEADPDAAGRLYAEEVNRAYTLVKKVLDGPTTGVPAPETFPIADTATVLYLGTYPSSAGRVKEGWEREGHVFIPSFGERGGRGGMGGPFRDPLARIFAAWLRHRDAADTIERGFLIGVFHDVKEVLPLAREYTAPERGRPLPPKARAAALAAIAQFGTPADLPRFEAVFDDTTELSRGRTTGTIHQGDPEPPPIVTQARDHAIGMAVLLYRHDPYKVGFSLAQTRFRVSATGPVVAAFDPFHFGFGDDKFREPAHKAARAWLAVQPKDAVRPDPLAKFWPHFAKTVGSDRLSQELFDLITTDRRTVELLERAAAGDPNLFKLYLARRDELNAATKREDPNRPGASTTQAVPLPAVAGWLLLGTYTGAVGSDPGGPSPQFLDVGLGQNPLADMLGKGEYAPPLRKLVAAWLANQHEYSALKAGLTLALKYDIRDALGTARALKSFLHPNTKLEGVEAYQAAVVRSLKMLVVGKYGTKADLPRLEQYIDDPTRVYALIRDPPGQRRPGYAVPIDGQDITTLVQDVAVAMMLHLSGRKPQDFGFVWLTAVEGKPVADVFALGAIGFVSQKDRDAAHQKARAWLDEQKAKKEP